MSKVQIKSPGIRRVTHSAYYKTVYISNFINCMLSYQKQAKCSKIGSHSLDLDSSVKLESCWWVGSQFLPLRCVRGIRLWHCMETNRYMDYSVPTVNFLVQVSCWIFKYSLALMFHGVWRTSDFQYKNCWTLGVKIRTSVLHYSNTTNLHLAKSNYVQI